LLSLTKVGFSFIHVKEVLCEGRDTPEAKNNYTAALNHAWDGDVVTIEMTKYEDGSAEL